MAIPVGQRTVDIVKRLNRLAFRRDLQTNELRIETEYAIGYDEADGSFVLLNGDITTRGPYESGWILSRTPAQAGLDANATLGQILVTFFDALESGAVTIPPDPNAEPAPEPNPPA